MLKHTAGSLDEGYVLFAPIIDSTTYLIDKCGYVVHKWIGHYHPGLSVYLLPTGKLLKTGVDKSSPFTKAGGSGGIIQIIDWDGNVEWQYKLSTSTECQHHDIKYMPNGNILVIAWDKKTQDDVKLAGRNPDLFGKEFWSEQIKELRPIGKDSAEIVWQWKLWDHLIQNFDSTKENFGKVDSHTELIDANYGSEAQMMDWQHFNSIDYNSELDQILISSHNFNEIWIIDHSTTSADAASHKGGKYAKGGDILYRWGNPAAYKNGTNENQQLFYQHDATWIPKGLPQEGNIMIFNNLRGPNINKFSSVDIIKPPVDKNGFYSEEIPFGPTSLNWSYSETNPTDFRAINLSGAQMLSNGNVLICNGPKGEFFEIDTTQTIVWKYVNPVVAGTIVPQGLAPQITNTVFRCTFYPTSYSGLIGKDLTRIGLVENKNSNSEACSLIIPVYDNQNENETNIYPNPTNNFLYIDTEEKDFVIEIYDINGQKRLSVENIHSIKTTDLETGTYYVKLMSKTDFSSQFIKFIIWR